MQVISSLPGPIRIVGRKDGEFAVRHVRRRMDDDAALGQVAADFRELVPQALAALGFEEITSTAAIFPSVGLAVTDAVYQRGVNYLPATQAADGSWHVKSRAVKLQPYFQSGFPYEHDQWISNTATAWASAALALAADPSAPKAQAQLR